MKDFSEFTPTARRAMRGVEGTVADLAKRGIALALAALMVPLGLGNLAYAQEAPPPPPDQDYQGPPPDDGPPPQQWNALAPDQLNQLVAPIALYPDSLVAQVLAASTYPSQVVDADRFVQSYRNVPPDQLAQMVNQQPWDPSVKALSAFPSVLSNMDRNLDWTTQLGNAYYNQPQDVMSAVQVDRQEAYRAGRLRSTPQLAVAYSPSYIDIEPANPEVVYVPYYDPWVIWGWHRPYYRWYAPPPPPGFFMGVGVGFGFGVGIAVAAWRPWGWGCSHWGMGWGPHPYVAYNRVTYVSRSVTVINHGYYGHFDRRPEAREWNHNMAAAAYRHGYAAGARNGYNNGLHNGYDRGRENGYNRGYDRGEQNGYNRGYNRGQNNGYNRGQENRPAQNYNRPQPGFNRPQSDMRPVPNRGGFDRPQPRVEQPRGGFDRPQPRAEQPRGGFQPQTRMGDINRGGGRPAENRGNGGGGGRPENRGGGGGGGHPDNHGGGGGHPHR